MCIYIYIYTLYIMIATLHTRTRKSEIPLENATEKPLGISGNIHWESDNLLISTTEEVKIHLKMPLNIHWKLPLNIYD